MSQLTSHILDTSRGKPAAGVEVILFQQTGADWKQLARGITNSDGRIADLLDNDTVFSKGIFKLRFNTQPYFDALSVSSFYPWIEIVFQLASPEHYHIPLLLNPFGYTTYRGS